MNLSFMWRVFSWVRYPIIKSANPSSVILDLEKHEREQGKNKGKDDQKRFTYLGLYRY